MPSSDMIEQPTGQAARPRSAADGVSIVLPALNLEDTIGTTVAALRDELRPIVPALEFIVVDDGSTDGTATAVRRLCKTAGDVRLLRNERNLGKGVSVYIGLLAARYSKVSFTDADLPFATGSYARLVQRLLQGSRFVVASRRMADSEILVRMEVLEYAARRHLVGVAFNYMVRAGLGLPFHDTQCGLKAFDREVGIELFRRVRAPRFLFDVELLLAARHARIPVDEVPVCIRYNDFKSSVKLAADSTRMLWGLVMICLRELLGRYGTYNAEMEPEAVRGFAQEVLPADVAWVSPRAVGPAH